MRPIVIWKKRKQNSECVIGSLYEIMLPKKIKESEMEFVKETGNAMSNLFSFFGVFLRLPKRYDIKLSKGYKLWSEIELS